MTLDASSPLVMVPHPAFQQPQMQPCAGRNCGSTNPNLHSAECFEDYEKATGMAQPQQEPVALLNAIRAEPTEMIHKWRVVDIIQSSPPQGIYYTPPAQRKPMPDDEIWKFWWSRPEVPEGEDDSMEAEFVAAVRAVLAAHGIKENT